MNTDDKIWLFCLHDRDDDDFFSLSGRFGSYRYRQGNGFVLVVLLLHCLFCGKIMNRNNYILYLLDSLAWIIRRTKDEFLGSCAQLQSCHLLQVSELLV